MPKVEFGGQEGADDDGDMFEDQLEDALCVFRSGANGKETDILKENEGQLLFYIDLENETIIDKVIPKLGVDDERDDLEEDI